jgi:DNA-3-methyladenine glycosylase II
MEASIFDAREAHERFLGIAEDLSPRLAADLRTVGPVEYPERDGEALCLFLSRAIIGQQLSTKAARSIWNRMEARIAAEGSAVPDFFVPANAEALRACGSSNGKVKALIAIREAHAAGQLHDGTLAALPAPERTAQLLGIWGVGQWTCDMASIFHFRDPDIWPEGDVAVRKTFARYIGRKKPTKAAARFAPQRSVLALYMWRILDRVPAT